MSKLGVMRAENPLDIITASDEPKENPFKVEAKCVGCDTKVGLTQCDGTMCRECWSRENE